MKKHHTLLWMRSLLRGRGLCFALLMAGNILNAAVTVGYALVVRQIINAAITHRLDDTKLFLFMLAGLVTVQLLLRVGCRVLEERMHASVERQLRERLFAALLGKQYAAVTGSHSGEWLSRIEADGKVVADGVVSLIPNAVLLFFKLVLAFAALTWFDWTFAPVLLIAGAAMLGLTLVLRGKLKQMHAHTQQSDADMRSFLQERLGGLQVIKAFNAAADTNDKVARHGEKWRGARVRQRTFAVMASAGMTFLYNAGYVYALARCARNLLNAAMDFGTVTTVLQLVIQVQTPFSSVSGLLPQYYAMIASVQRLQQIEQLPDELPALPETAALRAFGAQAQRLCVDKVTFGYDDTQVLCDASCDIPMGAFTVITGTSGIGKSTLSSLLLGIYQPQSGQVFVQNGQQTRALDASTRALFAFVPQGNGLFAGTVGDNLRLAAPDASDEDMRRALSLCCADTFADDLDAVIGEDGRGLSEGQAQRLALARAVVTDAPILLLDEATAALDSATERKVLENLRGLKGRTVVLITHKQAALEMCDVHLHLRDGKIERV